MPTWVDGQPASVLPLTDRGLAYGDGVFETIAVRRGKMPLLARHLDRLSVSATRLALPLELSRVEHDLRVCAAEIQQGVLKLMVTRGDGLRGYAPPADAQCRYLLSSAALPAYPKANARDGIRLFPCQTRLAIQPLLAGLKHLNRLEQVLARAEWQSAQYAEGLMCDTDGRIIEGVFSNLFLIKAGVLLTPALVRCGVAGTMRAELLARASALGWSVEETDLTLSDFYHADEVFFCNSLYGIWPVIGLEERAWSVGNYTRQLQAQLIDLLDFSR